MLHTSLFTVFIFNIVLQLAKSFINIDKDLIINYSQLRETYSK